MSRRLFVLAGVLGALGVACTEVATDPDAVVAVRFDGSDYPSIVAGDSLRDSLGLLQPVRATGLNYKGDSIGGGNFVFSSPDTVLRVFSDGNVFATRRKTDAAPARVFATSGTLQSRPDSLYVVQRADSLRVTKQVDTISFDPTSGGASAPSSLGVQVLGDTAAGKPKAPVQGWLVSFRLRYHGTTIQSTDTSYAYTFELNNAGSARVHRVIDTTDVSGAAGRRLFVRSLSAAEDTIVLIATIRQRKADTDPITDSTLVIIRPKPPSTLRSK